MIFMNTQEDAAVNGKPAALIFALCLVCLGGQVCAACIDWGENREFFHDESTGLYWYDPGTFAGWSPDQIDTFIKNNPWWHWACQEQISDLYAALSVEDSRFQPDILGRQTYSTGSSTYWAGFMSPDDPFVAVEFGWTGLTVNDTVSLQFYTTLKDDPDDENDNPIPVISGTVLHGAWLYSVDDPLSQTAPVPEPSTIFLIGTGLIGVAGFMRKISMH